MGLLIKVKGRSIEEIRYYLGFTAEYVIEGKIIGFPTDSVYGLGGDPQNIDVINKIFNIKFRDRTKGLLLLLSDIEEAKKVAEFNSMASKLAEHFWPGQLTLILNKKEPNIIPPELTAFKNTIGLRVPNNKIILEILNILKQEKNFGGLIGTSANYSGEPPSVSGDEVAKKFLSPIDLIIDGGKSLSKLPTTIVDCTSNTPEILRIGAITEEEILEVLNQEDLRADGA
ncbi:MAG: threonylcarbamoyl-AMP synthase [Promethearchaeota archaeon]|nr:MAG: threonylcarbamoyl-AMP synthase [Candidatus Lokiarchaeota archaeon]